MSPGMWPMPGPYFNPQAWQEAYGMKDGKHGVDPYPYMQAQWQQGAPHMGPMMNTPQKGKGGQHPAKPEKKMENVPRTTVMLRNLPSEYTSSMLLDLLNSEGFNVLYTFVYLPIDFRRAKLRLRVHRLRVARSSRKVPEALRRLQVLGSGE